MYSMYSMYNMYSMHTLDPGMGLPVSWSTLMTPPVMEGVGGRGGRVCIRDRGESVYCVLCIVYSV
jgi:hypothetical protein